MDLRFDWYSGKGSRLNKGRKVVAPDSMAQKPISSILEKIRNRKMEVAKKTMIPARVQGKNSVSEIALDSKPNDGSVYEKSDSRLEKATLTVPVSESSALDDNQTPSPVVASEGEHCLTTRTSTEMDLGENITSSFRAPINDTQDIFDSQTSEAESDQSKEQLGNQASEHVASPLPSLNLKFDSAAQDDISSDEEGNEEYNIRPHPRSLLQRSSSPRGDPVKEFVDEEALEDDSDNDMLQFEDEEECGNADVEEVNDYIATDYKEKSIDQERRNELHQLWLQQQDEAGTENLLQRLKHGPDDKELSVLGDEDDDRQSDESHDDDDDDDDDDDHTGDLYPMRGARVSTKKLKQMIPQMFTEKDDGFVSSDDEEIERKLSKERMLQKRELAQQPKLFSLESDETSRDVFGRIKKLNAVPESKKKPKSSYSFDNLLIKGISSSSSKSSFLRRSSSHPVTVSHRTGSSTGRSFIFGRDDSNSRSSFSLSEDSPDSSQKETNAKNASPRIVSSQRKRTTQQAEIRSEVSSSISLFEVLRRSSLQKSHDTQDNTVDHQAVFAAFKSVVKKRVKIDQGSQ